MRSVTKFKIIFFISIFAIIGTFVACDQVSQMMNPEKAGLEDIPPIPQDTLSPLKDGTTASDLDSISSKTLAEKLIYKGKENTNIIDEKKPKTASQLTPKIEKPKVKPAIKPTPKPKPKPVAKPKPVVKKPAPKPTPKPKKTTPKKPVNNKPTTKSKPAIKKPVPTAPKPQPKPKPVAEKPAPKPKPTIEKTAPKPKPTIEKPTPKPQPKPTIKNTTPKPLAPKPATKVATKPKATTTTKPVAPSSLPTTKSSKTTPSKKSQLPAPKPSKKSSTKEVVAPTPTPKGSSGFTTQAVDPKKPASKKSSPKDLVKTTVLHVKVKDNSKLKVPVFNSRPSSTSGHPFGNLIQKYGVNKITKPFRLGRLANVYKVEFSESARSGGFIRDLKKMDFVEYAEPFNVPNASR